MMREVKTKFREPWFLSNDNDTEEWCITDGVETFPLADASQTELGLAVQGTIERAAVQQPNRDTLIASLKVAMLGTTDGDFIEPESDIPAGEMFRLAAEWVEANLAALAVPTTPRNLVTPCHGRPFTILTRTEGSGHLTTDVPDEILCPADGCFNSWDANGVADEYNKEVTP